MSSDRKVDVQLTLDLGDLPGKSAVAREEFKGIDKDVEQLAFDFDGLDNAVSKAGRQFVETAAEAGFLNRELSNTRDKLRELEHRFDATGDTNLLKQIRSTRTELNQLEKVSKDLDVSTIQKGFFSAFSNIGPQISRGFFKSLSNLPPEVQPAIGAALVGAVAASSITIGAAVGGAILGGVALAGIGAAIAVQAKDPQVGAAFSLLGSHLLESLTFATKSFQPVLLDTADKFGASFDKLAPGLQHTFEQLAPVADHLVTGITKMAENAAPGFEKAMIAGGVIVDSLAKTDLPQLGSAIGGSLSIMAKNAAGAAGGLHQVLVGAEALLVTVSGLVSVLEKANEVLQTLTAGHLDTLLFGAMAGFNNSADGMQKFSTDLETVVFGPGMMKFVNRFGGATEVAKSLGDAVSGVSDKAKAAATNFQNLTSILNQTKYTADSVAGAMTDRVFSALVGIDESALNSAESLTNLTETLKKNKNALDIHSVAGQADREVILNSVKANIAAYDANIASGDSAADAAAKYDVGTAALEKQMRQAGLSKDQIAVLVGQYRKVPTAMNTTIAIEGLTAAITDLATLLRQINGLHDKTITLRTYQYVFQNSNVRAPGSAQALGGVRHGAVGMVIPPSDPGTTLVGEPQTGGEVLTPLRGISQGKAMELSGIVGDAYGFDVVARAAHSSRWAGSQPAGAAAGGAKPAPVYNVTVNASPGTSGAEVGAQVVRVIKRYEQANGTGWRN